MTRFRTWWRFGYGEFGLTGVGWVRVVWRFWWLDRKLERQLLEQYASAYGIEPRSADETNDQLRQRILDWMVR